MYCMVIRNCFIVYAVTNTVLLYGFELIPRQRTERRSLKESMSYSKLIKTKFYYVLRRFAALSDGSKCRCQDQLPLSSLSPRPRSSCNIPCSATPNEQCGGAGGLMSVWVGTCPMGKDRFGDHCYLKSPAAKTFKENLDYCRQKVRTNQYQTFIVYTVIHASFQKF